MRKANLTRRDFLRLAIVGAAGAVVAACGGGTPPAEAPTAAPANAVPNTAGAEAATAETPTAGAPAGGAAAPIAGVPRGQAKDVPREKSLIIMWTVGQPGIGNPVQLPAGHNVNARAVVLLLGLWQQDNPIAGGR